jgi:hypothetical protein
VGKWCENCGLAIDVLYLEVDGRLQDHSLGATVEKESSRDVRGRGFESEDQDGIK